MAKLQGAIATTRFGMGASPGEISNAASDPRGWLKQQVTRNAAILPRGELETAERVLARRFSQTDAARGDRDAMMVVRTDLLQQSRATLQDETVARLSHAATTPDSFAERWVRFWSNHFSVSARDGVMTGIVGAYEREAIRPNVFGAFDALLQAAAFHPGMLIYLDAARSIGPSSHAARRRKVGLNENLAREIMELHTLGVGSGYTQGDIVEFAKALTGWTVGGVLAPNIVRVSAGEAAGAPGRTVFHAPLHEPGARKVLGKSYPEAGGAQARSILSDLAHHPATARQIATKLARHFVADQPPAAVIAKLETAFTRADGDLAALARSVINLDEAWTLAAQKFKTPEELAVSVARAAGALTPVAVVRQVYASLAMQPFTAPSPEGWPDDAASWASADAIKKRLEWCNSIARRMARGPTPSEVLDAAIGDLAGKDTRQAVAFAESAEQGFTLLLMSPEFQRR